MDQDAWIFTFLLQRQIEALTLEYYDRVAADVWTMSPPCQPYTRVGLQQGSQDARSRSFLYLLDVLKQMVYRPRYILVENVKGFEVREILYYPLVHACEAKSSCCNPGIGFKRYAC